MRESNRKAEAEPIPPVWPPPRPQKLPHLPRSPSLPLPRLHSGRLGVTPRVPSRCLPIPFGQVGSLRPQGLFRRLRGKSPDVPPRRRRPALLSQLFLRQQTFHSERPRRTPLDLRSGAAILRLDQHDGGREGRRHTRLSRWVAASSHRFSHKITIHRRGCSCNPAAVGVPKKGPGRRGRVRRIWRPDCTAASAFRSIPVGA